MEGLEKRPTAYSYVRMSSLQQIKGDSLRRQLELSRAYAAEHNLNLDDSFRDIGVSAWTGANVRDGALGRFFHLVQTGQIERGSYLLVESFDRLSRQQVRKSIGPLIDLLNAGILLVTLGDKQVYSESSVDDNYAQLILSLAVMSRAHEESQMRSKRLKEAYENRRIKASVGQARFANKMWGWLDEVKSGPDKFSYTSNQHAETIVKIFELADIGLGHLGIARQLNGCKTPTIRGGKAGWQQSTISKILKNEAVIGTYQPVRTVNGKRTNYGDPVPNYLPAIVNDELFWRVQRNKKNRISRSKRGRRLNNIIGTIAICAWCQNRMNLIPGTYHGKYQRFIRCAAKYRGVHCLGSKSGFLYEMVENAVLDNLHRFGLGRAFGSGNSSLLRSDLMATIVEKSKLLADLKKRRLSLVAFAEVADSSEERNDIFNAMKGKRAEIECLKAYLAELRSKLNHIDSNLNDIAEMGRYISNERLTWSTGPDNDVHESRSKVSHILTQFIQNVTFDTTERQFSVVIIGGLRAYSFNDKGELLNC